MSTTIKKQNVQGKPKTTKTIKRKDDEKEEKKKTVTSNLTGKPINNGVGKATTSIAGSTTTTTKPTIKKRVPNSPTSSRVLKSQYYPDKSLYSRALTTNSTTNKKTTESPKIKPALANSTNLTKTKTVTKTKRDVSTDRSNVNKRTSINKVAVTKTTPHTTQSPKKSLTDIKKEMRDKLKKTSVKVDTKSKIKKSETPDSSTSSSHLERPRTATLKRPSIVSSNVAGPDIIQLKNTDKNKDNSSVVEESISTQMDTELNSEVLTETINHFDDTINTNDNNNDNTDEDNYEDDFDSYASDFEEYQSQASSKEESLTESSEPLDVTTEGEETSSSDGDNDEEDNEEQQHEELGIQSEANTPPRRVNSAEEERKLDSGNFDLPNDQTEPKRMKILDRIKEHEPVLSSLSDEGFEEQKTSLQFVNFADAQQKRQKQKTKQKLTKRGEELMSMIRLDQQNFTLFDLPAQSYDVYIKSFGNRNSTQVSSQTGDERVDEEVQTDLIKVANKWTQFPIDKITKSKNPLQFKEELLGVGSDTLEVNLLKEHPVLEYNEYNLGRFLVVQEKLISELLKENQYGCKAEMTTGKFPFSQGYLVLNTDDLKIGPTKSVTFSYSNKNPKIITVHQESEVKSHGYVWSLIKPSTPEDDFIAFGEISDVTFGLDNDKLIFGGFKDGCLAVWDLLEDFGNHQSRPPSFLTEVDFDSIEEVVKVLCFKPLKSNDFQVITLNESGKVVIWALIITPTESLGLNRISLVRNNTILLGVQHQTGSSLQCTDLCLNPSEPNHFYVSTNFGVILHSLLSGTRTNPKKYNTGLSTIVNVLEGCPHNPNYFLAGCASGEVTLHTKHFEKPLMTISNQESNAPVIIAQWSRNRPCIFYTLDANNNINIWDLSVSELYPELTVHLKEKVIMLKVSPLKSETSYMAVVTGDGKLHLHLLNQEHGMQEVEVYEDDLRKLNNYVQKL